MDAAPPIPRTLARSLDLVAEDLAELVGLGERVQGVISRMAAAAPRPRDASLLMEAQAADLLSQRLAGLAAFVRALADAERRGDPDVVLAAARTLTLAEQARRLADATPAAPADPAETSTFWD